MSYQFLDSHETPVPYNNQPITWRISAYAVILKDEQILLKRGEHESMWDMPGGGVEPHENLQDACLREVMEEVGTKAKLGEALPPLEAYFYYKEKQTYHHTLRFFYLGSLLEELGSPQDPKIKEVKWWPLSEINEHDFQDDVRYVTYYLKTHK